jgi:hypothetical protein
VSKGKLINEKIRRLSEEMQQEADEHARKVAQLREVIQPLKCKVTQRLEATRREGRLYE